MGGQTDPLGPPPDHLPPAEVACWTELVGMTPPDSLKGADRWMIEIGAYVLNRWRVEGRQEDGVVLADCLRMLGVVVPGERSTDAASLGGLAATQRALSRGVYKQE